MTNERKNDRTCISRKLVFHLRKMVAVPGFQMTWGILLISWKVIETMHMQGVITFCVACCLVLHTYSKLVNARSIPSATGNSPVTSMENQAYLAVAGVTGYSPAYDFFAGRKSVSVS